MHNVDIVQIDISCTTIALIHISNVFSLLLHYGTGTPQLKSAVTTQLHDWVLLKCDEMAGHFAIQLDTLVGMNQRYTKY